MEEVKNLGLEFSRFLKNLASTYTRDHLSHLELTENVFRLLAQPVDTVDTSGCVLVYRYTEGITTVLSFVTSICLAVVYCWVFCIGS